MMPKVHLLVSFLVSAAVTQRSTASSQCSASPKSVFLREISEMRQLRVSDIDAETGSEKGARSCPPTISSEERLKHNAADDNFCHPAITTTKPSESQSYEAIGMNPKPNGRTCHTSILGLEDEDEEEVEHLQLETLLKMVDSFREHFGDKDARKILEILKADEEFSNTVGKSKPNSVLAEAEQHGLEGSLEIYTQLLKTFEMVFDTVGAEGQERVDHHEVENQEFLDKDEPDRNQDNINHWHHHHH